MGEQLVSNIHLESKVRVIRYFLHVSVLYLAVFVPIFTFIYHFPVVLAVHLFDIAVVAACYWGVHHRWTLDRITLAMSCIAYLTVASVSATGGAFNSGPFLAFPYIPYITFLRPPKSAYRWMIAMLATLIGVLFLGIMGALELPYSLPTFGLYIFNYIIALLLIAAYIKEKDESDQQALVQTKALDEAQKTAHIGSWEWDIKNDRIVWSNELYRIFGLTPQEFEATFENYLSFIHAGDRKLVETTIQKAREDHQPFDFYHRLKLKDGEVRTLHSLGSVEVGLDGQPIRMLGTAQDVTESRKSQDELERRTVELEKLNQLMVGRELKMVELKKQLDSQSKKTEKPNAI